MGGSLKLVSLSKHIGDFKLEVGSLEVAEEEYFVILGPSGAGKTVLLQLVAGILRPDSGSIMIGGKDVTHLPPEERNVGYVPQNYALFPHMDVYDNIAYGLKVRGLDRSVVERRVKEIADRLEISHLLRRRPATLSGGEAQRVALARALAVEPKLLLLDEPLSAVDPNVRWELRGYLRSINEEFGVTVLHVTHDFVEAISLADRVAVMDKGTVMQIGEAEEVFYKPVNEFVARFTRSQNVFKGTARARSPGLSEVRVGSLSFIACGDYEGEVILTFRPESVIVSKARLQLPGYNEFLGRVRGWVDEGAILCVDIDVEGTPLKAYVTKVSFREMRLRKGDEVYAYVSASQLHVIKQP